MATFAIDLISGSVHLFVPTIGGGGSGSTSGSTYTEVDTVADLPAAAVSSGQTYLVLESTGTYVVDRDEAGLYYSNGTIWYRLGNIPSFFDSDNFQIYDTTDNTKGVEFVTSGITSGFFRQIEVQDKDGVIALLSDIELLNLFYTGDTPQPTSLTPTIWADAIMGASAMRMSTGATVIDHFAGQFHWDRVDGTASLGLLHDSELQVGQENMVFGVAYEDLVDGDVISIYGFTSGGTPILGKADIPLFGIDFYTGNDVGVMTSIAVSGQTCYATIFGKVRGLDTSAWSATTTLWLSNIVRGELTDIEPIFPEQKIPIAFVARQDVTEGEILVNPALDLSPQLNNLEFINDYFIGTFVDRIAMDVTVTGGTAYLNLFNADSGETTFRVMAGTDDVRTFTAQTIALIPGTQAVPVLNYVSMTALGIQVNTGWFTGNKLDTDGTFGAVATLMVQGVADVAIDGVYKMHGYIDNLLTDSRGNNVKQTERMRKDNAVWDNGVLSTVVRTAEALVVDRIDISTTQGIIFQKNRNTFPIRTTIGDLIKVHVVNGVPNYYEISHLGEITGQTDGTAWNNGNRVNFVVWGVSSQNAVDCKVMVNTCSGIYGNDGDAIEDPNNFSDYGVPEGYVGTAFLIARITAQYSTTSNGTWTIVQTESLLGRIIGVIGGGSVGSGTAIAVKNSIEQDVDLIYQLVGDELTPTADYFYGVDSGSTKGWHPIPSDNAKLDITTFTGYTATTQIEIDSKANAYAAINNITGTTTIASSDNGNIIQASGVTGSTGYTITIPIGLTVGFSTTIVNFLETGIITIASNGTLLSRDSAVTMVDQYGGATLYHQGNNIHVLMGDVT